MKTLTMFSFLILAACSHKQNPSTLDGAPVAYDSTALGKVNASAIKVPEAGGVCLDVALSMKDVDQSQAKAIQWDASWVDKLNHPHHLTLSNNPGTHPQGQQVVAPYGAFFEWHQSFKTCIKNKRPGDVRALILIPKNIPLGRAEKMQLRFI